MATPDPTSYLVHRLNDFGARLWQSLAPAEGNQAVAPMSVGICLSMLIDGAHEPTKQDLLKTLGIQSTEGAAPLIASLKQAGADQFTISNGVWLRSKSQLNPAYQRSIVTNFGGVMRRFTNAAAALPEINGWVKERTKNRIPTIFDQLDPDTSVVLVNALTFDGKWQSEFDKKDTQDGDFHVLGGETVQIPMMHMSGSFQVWRDDAYSSMTLPYLGGRFKMVFVLPETSEAPASALTKWMATHVAAAEGHLPRLDEAKRISIPKFKIECSYNLKPALGKMGLAPLYEDAKLGGIAPDLDQLTKIDQIQHKTYINVDEEGTQAAAATGVAVVTRAILVKPLEFKLNRPFAYAIVDQQTGAIIMMGTVANPKV